MANIVSSDDDQNNQNNQNQNFTTPNQPISVGGAGGSAPVSGTTGGTSGSGSSSTGSGTTSNNNAGTQPQANMQQMVNANQQTGVNDGQIGNWLTGENSSVGGLMTNAWNSFQGSVGSTPTFSQDIFNNAINNSDPTSQQTLKSWLTGQYSGPSSWDTSTFTPQMTQYQNDLSQLGSQGGLYNWLTSNMQGETPGAAQMDAASIWGSPNYQNDLSTWNNQYGNLNTQYNGYNTQASTTASNMTNAYNQLGTTTKDALSSYANGQMNNFNTDLSGASNQYTALQQQLAQDQAQAGAQGVSMSPYYSLSGYTAPTLSNYLQPSQVTGYNNAENLLGGTPINATGNWSPGSISFDASGYNSAVNTAAQSAAQKAAAAAQASLTASLTTPTGIIGQDYQSMLGRAPEQAGIDYYTSQMPTLGASGIAKEIAASPEATIYNAYQTLLGRAPDTAGQQFYSNQLSSGMTPAQIQQEIQNSPEYQNRSKT